MAKRSVVVGADSWISTVEELSVNSDRLASRAVYGGAATIADGIREAIKRIPAQTVDGGNRRGVTDVERQGLLDGLGVAQHQRADGVVNTKIGFDGYNAYTTKKYPKGQDMVELRFRTMGFRVVVPLYNKFSVIELC